MDPGSLLPEVVPLLSQLGSAIAADGIRVFLTREEDSVALAVKATAARFAEIEGAEVALERWTQSDTFTEFFERLHAGERDVVEEEVIASFVAEGGFHEGPEDEGAHAAADLLVAFLAELLGVLYRGEEALPAHVNRVETLHTEHESRSAARFESFQTEVKDEISRLRSSIETAGLLAEPTEPGALTDPEHLALGEKVDFARDLINRGLVDTARQDLAQLREAAGSLPKELQFRIFTNLGASSLATEDVDAAATYLEHAHELQPDNPKAISNAAIAAHIRKDSKRATELAIQAREAVAENSQATVVLLEELWEAGCTDKLESLVSAEAWIWGDRNCGIALASIRLRQDRFPEAVTLCRTLAAAHPDDPGIRVTLGQCLLKEAQAALQSSTGNTGEALEELREAEAALQRATELLGSTQLSVQRHDALVALGNVHALLGLPTAAMADLNRVLSESPSHPDANFLKGLLLLDEGQPAAARIVLELARGHRGDDVLGPLAGACIDSGDAVAAVNLLRGSFSLDDPEWEDVQRGVLLIRAEATANIEDSVGPAIEAALADHPNSARLLTLAGAHSDLGGGLDESVRLLTEALEQAGELDRREVLTRLATLLQRSGRFPDAADLLAEVIGDAPSHPAACELLVCLVNAQRLREALAWAQRIRQAQPQLPRQVLEAEAKILERAGDTPAAISRLKELCSHVDSTAVDPVTLAAAQFRGGERDAAVETIGGIRPANLCNDPLSLLRLAQLKMLLEEHGGLDDAYLAYRCGLDEPSVYLGYLGIYLACETEVAEPEVASSGCAVLLRGESKEQWYQLLDGGEIPYNSYHLQPTQPLAQRLVGAQVEDTIVLREGLEDLSYEVVALQSKFLRAFQEIHEEFSTRFPEHEGLSRVVGGDKGLAKVLTTIDQRDRFANEVERMYREGRLPFASFCSLLGRTVLEGWRGCTESRSIPIRCGVGTDEETGTASKLLRGADGIVLDLLALLTVHELGLAAKLQSRFPRVVVPQLVIEELQEAYYNTVLGPTPSGYLGKSEDGQYSLTEMTEAGWEQQKAFVRSVLSLAESLDRVPSYGLLEADDAEGLIEMLTWAGVGAVYAGELDNAIQLVLVSDDLGLASVARHLGADVANTQAALGELCSADVITSEEYSLQIERLALLNYRFVRVDAKDILRRLEEKGYATTDGTRALLGTLEGPDCSEESAISVAAEVVVTLARKALRHQVVLVLGLVFEVLLRGRQGTRVLQRFRVEVESRLFLDPVTSNWLLPTIDSRLRM